MSRRKKNDTRKIKKIRGREKIEKENHKLEWV